jgi:hypothetical protein
MKFDDAYKSKFDELGETPPDAVWDNISTELDLDDVWTSIDSTLNLRNRRRKMFYIGLSAAMLLFISAGTFFLTKSAKRTQKNELVGISDSAKTAKKSTIYNELLASATSLNAKTNNSSSAKAITTNKNKLQATKKTTSYRNNQKINNPSRISIFEYVEEVPEEPFIDETKSTNLIFPSTLSRFNPLVIYANVPSSTIDSALKLNYSKLTKSESLIPKTHYMTVGTAYTFSNSWLLNADTYNGLRKNRHEQTFLSFGRSYSIYGNYSLSPKFDVQAEWLIDNLQTQNNTSYVNGKTINKGVALNYTHLNIVGKKKNERLVLHGTLPISINYLTGLQMGYLKSSKQVINGETSSNLNQYTKLNYSFILGVESSILIRNVWVVSSSLRSVIGVHNIYTGTVALPSNLNRTYNSSLGIHVGLGYRFKLN